MDTQGQAGGDAPGPKLGGSKARRKPGPKAAPPESPRKRSLNLRIDDETYERLNVHAMKRKVTISELVMELARDHLRRYVVSDRGGPIGIACEAG